MCTLQYRSVRNVTSFNNTFGQQKCWQLNFFQSNIRSQKMAIINRILFRGDGSFSESFFFIENQEKFCRKKRTKNPTSAYATNISIPLISNILVNVNCIKLLIFLRFFFVGTIFCLYCYPFIYLVELIFFLSLFFRQWYAARCLIVLQG